MKLRVPLSLVAAVAPSRGEPDLLPPPSPNRKPYPYVGTIVLPGALVAYIETAKGQIRSGKDADGKPWSVTMPHHYGEIRGTVGCDGDPVDVFIGPSMGWPVVYCIPIKNAETGEYDEDKFFMGFKSSAEVEACFGLAYDRLDLALDLLAIPGPTFLEWIKGRGTEGNRVSVGVSLQTDDNGKPLPARRRALREALVTLSAQEPGVV